MVGKHQIRFTTYTTNDAQHHVIDTPPKPQRNVVVALGNASGHEEKKRKWKASPITLNQERRIALGDANDDKPAGRVALMHEFDPPAASIRDVLT